MGLMFSPCQPCCCDPALPFPCRLASPLGRVLLPDRLPNVFPSSSNPLNVELTAYLTGGLPDVAALLPSAYSHLLNGFSAGFRYSVPNFYKATSFAGCDLPSGGTLPVVPGSIPFAGPSPALYDFSGDHPAKATIRQGHLLSLRHHDDIALVDESGNVVYAMAGMAPGDMAEAENYEFPSQSDPLLKRLFNVVEVLQFSVNCPLCQGWDPPQPGQPQPLRVTAEYQFVASFGGYFANLITRRRAVVVRTQIDVSRSLFAGNEFNCVADALSSLPPSPPAAPPVTTIYQVLDATVSAASTQPFTGAVNVSRR